MPQGKYNAEKHAEVLYDEIWLEACNRDQAIKLIADKLKRTRKGGILIGVRAANSKHRKEIYHD